MSMPGYSAETALSFPHRRYGGDGTRHSASEGSLVSAQAYWGPTKNDGCIRRGVRRHSAILHDVPWNESWETWCEETPGLENRPPNHCVNVGWNMWGQWDVSDSRCRGRPF